VLLTGTPGSGKTKALAVLSKRTLAARNDSSRHTANVQIYFQMTGKHNMESALRYIYLELVLQLRGVTELKHSSPIVLEVQRGNKRVVEW
jgi:predicted ATPase